MYVSCLLNEANEEHVAGDVAGRAVPLTTRSQNGAVNL
jgi:hypothetical protein